MSEWKMILSTVVLFLCVKYLLHLFPSNQCFWEELYLTVKNFEKLFRWKQQPNGSVSPLHRNVDSRVPQWAPYPTLYPCGEITCVKNVIVTLLVRPEKYWVFIRQNRLIFSLLIYMSKVIIVISTGYLQRVHMLRVLYLCLFHT